MANKDNSDEEFFSLYKIPLGKSRAEIEQLAKDNQLSTPGDIDTFRHIYASTIAAERFGEGVARDFGTLNEIGGAVRNVFYYFFGESHDNLDKLLTDSKTDIVHNEIGLRIARIGLSDQEKQKLIADYVKHGGIPIEAVSVNNYLNESTNFIDENLDGFFQQTKDYLQFRDPEGSAQYFAPDAPRMEDYWKEFSELPLFTTIITMLGETLNRALVGERKRIATMESERSLQAQANWNLSRNQQEIMLAQVLNRGNTRL